MSAAARQLPAPDRGRAVAEAPLRSRPAEKPAERTEPEQRPPLRVVPRRIRRRRAGVVAVLGVAAVFAVMLGLVAFQAKIAQDQLRLDRMDRDLRAASEQYQQLRLQVAQLEAPDRVIAEAKRLGLVRPTANQVAYVTPTPAHVAQVIAAGGVPADSGPAGTTNAEEWSTMKPLLRGGP